MKKRIIPLLLTLALILTLAPTAFITARAEEWTVIYSFDFESDPFSNGWTSEDLDGDGYGWIYTDDAGSFLNDPEPLYLSPEGSVYSESYSNTTFQSLQPDNLLWSPAIDIPATGKTWVGLAVRGSDPTDYDENFRIGYALPGDTAMTPMSTERTTENCWISYGFLVDSKLKGQTVRFCIEHYDTSGKFRLYLDDFDVVNYPHDDADEFDLWICGERVTGTSLSGEGYSYDPETNTLTLTGDIKAENNAAIQSGIIGLTINADPERSSCGVVSNGDFPALLLLEDTTITGSADNIYISCTTAEPAIYVGNNADLTFFDANVTVNSLDGDYAIYADDNLARLNVVKSHVAADSCVSAVYGFYQRVFLTASTLMNPAGGIIGEWEIFDAWGSRAKSVCFEPAETKLAGFCYDDFGDNGFEGYLISFYPTDVSSVTPGRACPEGASLESGVYVDGCYYAYSYDADECVSSFFKLPNGAAKWQEIPEVVPFQIISMSYDPYTESVYGIATLIEEAGDRALVKIDLATGGVETVKYYGFSLDSRLQAIAFGERGVCYGVNHYGDVYIIDVVNGDCFFSFSTDVICGNAGVVYDFENKALYWTQSSGAEDNGLYIIDLIAEKARFIGRIGGGMEIVGLYVAPAEQQYLKGDLDKDGEITVADALAALRIAAKLAEETDEAIAIGDIDGDNAITVSDALAILRVAAKLADESSLG